MKRLSSEKPEQKATGDFDKPDTTKTAFPRQLGLCKWYGAKIKANGTKS